MTSSWVENCTKFGQLILSKITKIVATSCHADFKAKMHQIRFRLELCPRPRWGSSQLSACPPDPLAGFKGPTSKGRGGQENLGRAGEGRGKREGKGRQEGERRREGRGTKGEDPHF